MVNYCQVLPIWFPCNFVYSLQHYSHYITEVVTIILSLPFTPFSQHNRKLKFPLINGNTLKTLSNLLSYSSIPLLLFHPADGDH